MNGDKPLYTPTHVTDSSGYDATRGAHRTKQVHYKLYDGTRSYVELPLDQYTAERVQELLDHAARQHQEIVNLQPGVPPPSAQDQNDPWSNG